jgi:hypothetical protein
MAAATGIRARRHHLFANYGPIVCLRAEEAVWRLIKGKPIYRASTKVWTR